MATTTDAVVKLHPSGQSVRADCFGNNVAIECPQCLQYPILIVALPNQRGASEQNPAICRHCGCRVIITDDLSPTVLLIVNIRIIPLP